jgi:uncharacterized protein
MNIEEKTEAAINFVKPGLSDYDSGHDWWHIERVRNLARYINAKERLADPFMLDIAAILHDKADSKFNNIDEPDIYDNIGEFLSEHEMEDIRGEITEIIRNVSFSSKHRSAGFTHPVLYVLQDSDKLDAIGAIGIARAFNYGGFRNNPIYMPGELNGGQGRSTIGHFYDKLLKLKDMMNTKTGHELALQRHHILLEFLDRFYSEWNFGTRQV